MLEKLRAELAAINMDDPEIIALIRKFQGGADLKEVQPDDEVIGPLDDENVRLNVLALMTADQAQKMCEEHEQMHLAGCHDPHHCMRTAKEMAPLLKRSLLLAELCSDITALDYSVDTDDVSLRIGWTLVKKTPSERKPKMILIDLLGGGPGLGSDLLSLLTGQEEPRSPFSGIFRHRG